MRSKALGLILVGIGLGGIFGSVTGKLPSMIAALFVPSALGLSTSTTTTTYVNNPPTHKGP